MENTPLVSIITPCFNASKYIDDFINSILNQTYLNWELLITDDCSTDDTVSKLNDYIAKDNRIKVFKLNSNQGAGVARNKSISVANGRFIAFCDSDDQWKPNKLKNQINFMITQNLSFTYSNYDLISESGKFIKTIKSPPILSYNKMLNNNYIGCLTAIYDTNFLGKMFMPTIRKRQDWVLWLKIFEKLNITKGVDESLAIYRIRNNSISTNKIEMLKYNWLVYRKELKFNFLMSAYYMIKFFFCYVIKKYL